MTRELESDGLLSIGSLPSGSPSFQADYITRQHPADIGSIQDFHALSSRYYEKIIAEMFSDTSKSPRRMRS
jgi:hypothetical protein